MSTWIVTAAPFTTAKGWKQLEWPSWIYHNANEPQNYANWKRPHIKDHTHITCVRLQEISRTGKPTETKQMWLPWVGRGETGCDCKWAQNRVPFGAEKMFWNLREVMITLHVKVLNSTELCPLKWFVIWIYCNKNETKKWAIKQWKDTEEPKMHISRWNKPIWKGQYSIIPIYDILERAKLCKKISKHR